MQARKPPAWRPVEKKVRGNVVCEVNELPLQVPKYSFKLGTVKFDENGQIIEVNPYLNIYNVSDAAELLREIGDKYLAVREERQRDFDSREDRFDDESPMDDNDGPDVSMRRNK
jgi:hypothetical protein